MSFELRNQPPGGLGNPPGTHSTFFINENGVPTLLNPDGTTSPAVLTSGQPLSLDDVATPSGEASKIKMYGQDVSGVTEFFLLDENDNAIQVTSNGSLLGGGGGLTLHWKDDTPGTVYGDGETAVVNVGEMVMVGVEDPEEVTLQLPAITPAIGGQTFFVMNTADKKSAAPGLIILEPNGTDVVGWNAPGESVSNSLQPALSHFEMVNDGLSSWYMTALGYTVLFAPFPPPP